LEPSVTPPQIHIPDELRDTYKAAYLASEGHTQEAIGDQLGLSQTTVYRKLCEAREMKLIGKSKPPWTGTEVARCTAVEMLSPVEDLSGRFAALSDRPERLLEVRIIENAHHTDENEHRDFARRAARYLLDDLLRPNDKIGCAWGGLLLSVAEEVERMHDHPSPKWGDIAFMPICGDTPEVFRTPICSAANIAAHFDRALTGNTDSEFTFSSVVGCIPHDFNGARAQTLREFFQTVPGYRKVFGVDSKLANKAKMTKSRGRRPAPADEEGMITQLDGVLTSLGTNEADNRWLVAAATAARVEPSELASACPGNVGGIFLSHPNPTAAQKKIVDRVNARWTGVSLEHLELCAQRATRDPKRIGVTVMACRGERQALIAIECVRLGLVSRLLLDRNTSSAIARALDRLEGGGAQEG
jgi:DNA-binding transcriptional regulator LsrR (DeoR family)